MFTNAVDKVKTTISNKVSKVKDAVTNKIENAFNATSKPLQEHHYLTNKSKKYTEQFKNIIDKYKLDLDDAWNKELLPHQGRHPYEYHEFVLDEITNIDYIANGDRKVFLDLFEENVKNVIRDNPNMLYKQFWLNH